MSDLDTQTFLIFIVILLFAAVVFLYSKWKTEQKQQQSLIRENSKLIADNALMEAEQLKFQLQPHTLNNILANLKVMASNLNKGMDALSGTLDYILYQGNFHLVTIEQEIEFIKRYLKLNDLFTTNIDSIRINTSKVSTHSRFYSSRTIPHLITAYFIENAFKHGDRYHPDFLRVELSLSDSMFEMIVVNKIKVRPIATTRGLGLKNMEKRLELLVPYKYVVDHNFTDSEYRSALTINFNA